MAEEGRCSVECLLSPLLVGINNTHMASTSQRLHRRNGFSSSKGRILIWVSKHFILQLKAKEAMSEIFASEP